MTKYMKRKTTKLIKTIVIGFMVFVTALFLFAPFARFF